MPKKGHLNALSDIDWGKSDDDSSNDIINEEPMSNPSDIFKDDEVVASPNSKGDQGAAAPKPADGQDDASLKSAEGNSPTGTDAAGGADAEDNGKKVDLETQVVAGPQSSEPSPIPGYVDLTIPDAEVETGGDGSQQYENAGHAFRIQRNLYVGNRAASADQAFLASKGIKYIINVADKGKAKTQPEFYEKEGIFYLDCGFEDREDKKELLETYNFLKSKLNFIFSKEHAVLIHCNQGRNRSVAICLLYAMEYKNMSLLDAYNHLKEIRFPHLTDVCTNASFQLVCTEKEIQMGRTEINTIATWPGSRNTNGYIRDRACKLKGEQKGSEVTDKRSRSTKPSVSAPPVSTKGATPPDVITSAQFVRSIQISKVASSDIPDPFQVNWFDVEFPKLGLSSESTPSFHRCSELLYDWRLVQGTSLRYRSYRCTDCDLVWKSPESADYSRKSSWYAVCYESIFNAAKDAFQCSKSKQLFETLKSLHLENSVPVPGVPTTLLPVGPCEHGVVSKWSMCSPDIMVFHEECRDVLLQVSLIAATAPFDLSKPTSCVRIFPRSVVGDDGCAVFCRPTGLTNEKFPDYRALFAPGASVLVLNAGKSFTVNHFAIGSVICKKQEGFNVEDDEEYIRFLVCGFLLPGIHLKPLTVLLPLTTFVLAEIDAIMSEFPYENHRNSMREQNCCLSLFFGQSVHERVQAVISSAPTLVVPFDNFYFDFVTAEQAGTIATHLNSIASIFFMSPALMARLSCDTYGFFSSSNVVRMDESEGISCAEKEFPVMLKWDLHFNVYEGLVSGDPRSSPDYVRMEKSGIFSLKNVSKIVRSTKCPKEIKYYGHGLVASIVSSASSSKENDEATFANRGRIIRQVVAKNSARQKAKNELSESKSIHSKRPISDVTPSDPKKESKLFRPKRLVADVEPSKAEPGESMHQDKKERMDTAFVISEFLQNYSTALPIERDNLARVESNSTSKVAANVLETISASLVRIEASVKNLVERTSKATALDAVAKSLKKVQAKVSENEDWKSDVQAKITSWADATQELSKDVIQTIHGTISDDEGTIVSIGPNLLELSKNLSSIPEQIKVALEPALLDIGARLSELPGHIKGDSGPTILELKDVMKGNFQTLDGRSNARFATAKQEHEAAFQGLATQVRGLASAAMSHPMSSSIISTSAVLGDSATQQLGSFN